MAELKHYLGKARVPEGFIRQPYAALTLRRPLAGMVLLSTLQGNATPPALNTTFNYYEYGGSLELRRSFWRQSTGAVGVSGAKSIGKWAKKTPLLLQAYQPLKTFVAGSGGGVNQNSFPITGSGALFTPRFGDTQARTSLNYTIPIIPQLNRLLWVFFVESLNFSAFINRGGAWFAGDTNLRNNILTAHGYTLDLLFGNKGVNLNFGLGTGQIWHESFQTYFKFGFDAFI